MKDMQAAEAYVCACVSGQTNSSPGHERGMAFLTLVLGGKAWYHANLQVNTILKLLENGGKECSNPVSGGKNMMSVGLPTKTGWKTQTRVINVQCLLLTQSNTLCRHSGSLFYRRFGYQITDETI